MTERSPEVGSMGPEKKESELKYKIISHEGNVVTLISGENVGYEVEFNGPEDITVKTYILLDNNPTEVEPGGKYNSVTNKWWNWSSTKSVGDYDGDQFRDLVTEAAKVNGVVVSESVWPGQE